jgi:hypothetical protein
MKNLVTEIAKNCQWHKTVNSNYITECEERIEKLQSKLPSGSGIDSGCKIDIENSGNKKIVITFSFHHMDENGYYDGWTNHKLIVKPELSESGFDLHITGPDKNFVKDYLYDLFDHILSE